MSVKMKKYERKDNMTIKENRTKTSIRNQSQEKEQNRGITLVALVVTIIVLVILATVSINAVLGENGLIKQAQKAKEIYEKSTIAEEQAMNELLEQFENIMQEPEDPTKDWDVNKVDKITSEDNIIVPVPKGYTASTITGEKSVSTGFVIKEGDNGAATEGVNEFVWVPVPEISDIYDEANKAGQLWHFDGTTSTKKTYPTTQNGGYREPDVITGASAEQDSTSGSKYDAVSANLQQAGLPVTATAIDFKKQLQSEFNHMIESVRIYKGFYIGRYETGNLSSTTKAVVQKNNSDNGSQTWYTMYKLSKTIGANENVKSSMVWGCQWDATLRWMQTSKNEEVKKFPTDSTGKGNYYEANKYKPIPTGINPAYAVNNIYDMGGNVVDWTLESGDNCDRYARGGYYLYDGAYAASHHDNGDPTYIDASYGSRSTLYVAL